MLLRLFSYLYALLFGLFLFGVSLVLLLGGTKNFKFDMLPFLKGETVLWALFALGVAGILSAVLSVLGKARALLVLFTVVMFGLIVYGFFISPMYRFPGAGEAKSVGWLSLIALVGVLGALAQYYRPDNRLRS